MGVSYYLKKDSISLLIERNHLCHEGFAQEIGISRSHWSLIYNRHQRLSPRARRKLLACPLLRGIPESELWDVVPTGSPKAA